MKLVAHRGYSARYPENTLLALESALKLGVHCIEFDVQMSADRQLFVHHDANLQRTTGRDAMIFDTSADELQSLSAGESKRFGDAFAGETIPTLPQALQLLAQYPEAMAFVEIKRHSLAHFGADTVMNTLLKEVTPYQRQCAVISFSTDAIEYTRKHSKLETGWVLRHYDHDSQRIANRLTPDYLICDQSLLPDNEPLWPGSREWMVYEINTAEAAALMLEKGIRYIETAEVEAMLASSLFHGQRIHPA